MLLPQSYQYPYLSEGADRVDGQLRGDKEYALLQWRNQFWQSLEEGTGKRCSECGVALQWRNQFWQSLEEGTGKRCSECDVALQWRNKLWQSLEIGTGKRCSECDMALLWRNQFWQSLEEGAGKRCSECVEWGLFFSLLCFCLCWVSFVSTAQAWFWTLFQYDRHE